jgi:hypothetical protein
LKILLRAFCDVPHGSSHLPACCRMRATLQGLPELDGLPGTHSLPDAARAPAVAAHRHCWLEDPCSASLAVLLEALSPPLAATVTKMQELSLQEYSSNIDMQQVVEQLGVECARFVKRHVELDPSHQAASQILDVFHHSHVMPVSDVSPSVSNAYRSRAEDNGNGAAATGDLAFQRRSEAARLGQCGAASAAGMAGAVSAAEAAEASVPYLDRLEHAQSATSCIANAEEAAGVHVGLTTLGDHDVAAGAARGESDRISDTRGNDSESESYGNSTMADSDLGPQPEAIDTYNEDTSLDEGHVRLLQSRNQADNSTTVQKLESSRTASAGAEGGSAGEDGRKTGEHVDALNLSPSSQPRADFGTHTAMSPVVAKGCTGSLSNEVSAGSIHGEQQDDQANHHGLDGAQQLGLVDNMDHESRQPTDERTEHEATLLAAQLSAVLHPQASVISTDGTQQAVDDALDATFMDLINSSSLISAASLMTGRQSGPSAQKRNEADPTGMAGTATKSRQESDIKAMDVLNSSKYGNPACSMSGSEAEATPAAGASATSSLRGTVSVSVAERVAGLRLTDSSEQAGDWVHMEAASPSHAKSQVVNGTREGTVGTVSPDQDAETMNNEQDEHMHPAARSLNETEATRSDISLLESHDMRQVNDSTAGSEVMASSTGSTSVAIDMAAEELVSIVIADLGSGDFTGV